MNPYIIADTSGLFALLSSKDKNHKDALNFYKSLEEGTQIVIIDYVLIELMNLLRARGHYHVAVQFRDSIEQSTLHSIHYVMEDLEREAFLIFK